MCANAPWLQTFVCDVDDLPLRVVASRSLKIRVQVRSFGAM